MHAFAGGDLYHVWVYLQSGPQLGLVATLLVWQGATSLDRRTGHAAWSNPIMVSIAVLAVLLLITGTSYRAYFRGGQYVQFLLGPATVALAVPMYANFVTMRRNLLPILVALIAGSVTASVSAMVITHWLGAPRAVVISMAPKSVTTPIAMGISQDLGGIPSLTAIFVLLTGVFGGLVCLPFFRLLRIGDRRAQGLAGGTGAHGLATARLLLESETAGAFGALAIGLNGLITAILAPLLVRFLGF
ncbi:LrgB family protein [Acidiphilium sp. AL]|uniref:LrgB family protein n=1 Tax=Acidiphilium iwatense TaxID=768198 RepID=A0ABS9DYC9_9PROT|nr:MULTISPECIES: LrgB family protein [Acidiphilium]MCF3946810.1 LrgB family protein [Acidiphilium iwatense]MCU4160839.1 LrgB family protein [Acidiphilium sp. AL]